MDLTLHLNVSSSICGNIRHRRRSRDNTKALFDTANTTLGSKIVNRYREQMAKIATDAVLAVADL